MRRYLIQIPLVFFLSTVAVNPALAGKQTLSSDQLIEKVRYSDLNLATSDGVKSFDGRISQAIRKVCSSFNGLDLRERQQFRRCHANAEAEARTQRAQVIAAAQAK